MKGSMRKSDGGGFALIAEGPAGRVLLDVVMGELVVEDGSLPSQPLTATEFAIIAYLLEKRDRSATVDELYRVGRRGSADSDLRSQQRKKHSVQQHICNLRAKFEALGCVGRDAITMSRATDRYRLNAP